ncbi:potassium-transporting ATPase subunit KdpC [Pararhodospirillum photometricum]|uniref:Potassium-transporting ATPase KdpC subunit n=1 Tax=Pararhodospirillum photometricum DSM 122 TaxID=1150469 RepID=H6SP66_PARPM|nr:potassium-transporting ATPase subunit KdpC [Pararhodospirillum photometricum]CCG07138.1 Potassium-transporting ATPase C chain [Pararhodospirillum photometricum DSM 122]
MGRELRAVGVFLAVMTVLLGLGYPLAVQGLGQLLFPDQAHGSLIRDGEGRPVGSALIGQAFGEARYFHSRPSVVRYDGAGSGASNLAPGSKDLVTILEQRLQALRSANPHAPEPVPADLVTASASGLDPHISPAAALWQVPRVARARALPEKQVREVIAEVQEGPTLGVFGQPRVNVLKLNLALDALARS